MAVYGILRSLSRLNKNAMRAYQQPYFNQDITGIKSARDGGRLDETVIKKHSPGALDHLQRQTKIKQRNQVVFYTITIIVVFITSYMLFDIYFL